MFKITLGSILLIVCPLLYYKLVEIATESIDHQCFGESRIVTRHRLDDFTKISDKVAIGQSNSRVVFFISVTRSHSIRRYKRTWSTMDCHLT